MSMSLIQTCKVNLQSESSRPYIKTVGTILVCYAFGKAVKLVFNNIKAYKKEKKQKADVDEKKIRLCQKLRSMNWPFANIQEICILLSAKRITERICNRSLKVIDVLEAFQANALKEDSENELVIIDIIYEADVEAIMLDTKIDEDSKCKEKMCILGWQIAISKDLKASDNYTVFKSTINKSGGIILYMVDSEYGPIEAVKSRSATASICIDSCEDLFNNRDAISRCVEKGLCSFRPTASSNPISPEGCLNLIGTFVVDLIELNNSLCFHGNDIDVKPDNSSISIGYWMASETKANKKELDFLLEKLKAEGHEPTRVNITEPTCAELSSLNSAFSVLQKAHYPCGNPAFVTVRSAMATISDYRTKVLREIKETNKVDVLVCIGNHTGHNLANVATLFTIATGIDIYSNNTNGLSMGVISCNHMHAFVCIATNSWEDDKCLRVMKMIG